VLGYDARMQLLHSEDALAVMERATQHDLPGVFNVGGDGVLMLSQAIRRAGRIALPVPSMAVPMVGRLVRSARLVDFSPDQMRFLNFGRVVDTTLLQRDFGFTPRWTTMQAFDDYVSGRALRPAIDVDTLAAAERGILDFAARIPIR
jgi:UDP-glucose 4-epimerase